MASYWVCVMVWGDEVIFYAYGSPASVGLRKEGGRLRSWTELPVLSLSFSLTLRRRREKSDWIIGFKEFVLVLYTLFSLFRCQGRYWDFTLLWCLLSCVPRKWRLLYLLHSYRCEQLILRKADYISCSYRLNLITEIFFLFVFVFWISDYKNALFGLLCES